MSNEHEEPPLTDKATTKLLVAALQNILACDDDHIPDDLVAEAKKAIAHALDAREGLAGSMSQEHTCFEEFDRVLAKHNAHLAFGMEVTEDLGLVARLLIATEKIDRTKRKPVPAVMASYCPFCGVKLESGDKPSPNQNRGER